MSSKPPSINSLLQEYNQTLPKKTIDGKEVFDFDRSPTALFVACFVICHQQLLIMKRSEQVTSNKGKWNVIAGYYDEVVEIKDKVLEEINEEASIQESQITDLKVRPTLEMKLPTQLWYVVPVEVHLTEKFTPELNWENTDFAWVGLDQLSDYDLVTGVKQLAEQILI